jgi:putative nucleotidyltransferase with HDIG domain
MFKAMIPTVEQCFEYMEKYEMLENIRAHSIVVEKVANLIARALRDVGVDVVIKKITAGALLHDIGKTLSLKTGGDHAAKGEEICYENQLDEIADIVGEHVRFKSYKPDKAICEKEIVYYADKRVNHDAVVSLEERLDYLLKRYGNNDENLCKRMRRNFGLCKEVERKLFADLAFGPEEMAAKVGER